jgi:methionyl aminopeptidase
LDGAPARANHRSTMPIEIFSPADTARIRRASRVTREILRAVKAEVAPGMSTLDIDARVRALTKEHGGKPSQLGYKGFPATVCTSRNEVVCHGIPRAKDVLREGDIVNVDCTTEVGGFHGDTSATFFVGEPSAEAKHVTLVARRCRDAGIAVVRDGARLGDIGAAIEELARREGCSVVRDFGGHGIGRKMHAEPHVPHYGTRGSGLRLKQGMVITIEPMVNLGTHEIRMLDDGWTVVTRDGRLSAQFEHTIAVGAAGPDVLTSLGDEDDIDAHTFS